MNPTGGTWWPTSCRVCRRWQGSVLCAGCLGHARLEVRRCTRCALRLPAVTALAAQDGLCQACLEAPPDFDHAIAVLDYAEPWSGLVASLKFREDTAMAGVLARLMAPAVARQWQMPADKGIRRPVPQAAGEGSGGRPARARWKRGAPTAIVPVPLSAPRLRERGYNQAGLLARALGARLGLPVWHDALARCKDTPRLMTLDADERLRHIRQAFVLAPRYGPLLQGRHVAVVDDVLTTGATLNEIASTLWLAGARQVSAWVAARTPLPNEQPVNPDTTTRHGGRDRDLG